MTEEKTSALHSRYIIDGVKQELTPAQLLDSVSVTPSGTGMDASALPVIVDETAEAGLAPFSFDRRKVGEYLRMVMTTVRKFPAAYSDTYTRCRIAAALTDTLWKAGSFKLCDIDLVLDWKWNRDAVGNMAAFHESAAAASDYIDSLGLRVADYSFADAPQCSLEVSPRLRKDAAEEVFTDQPYVSRNPKMSSSSAVRRVFVDDPKSWIVYIPFDTSDYRFGGSVLSQALRRKGGASLRLEDPDYFIDCFEVLREFVEDGVLLSASTVADGGLLAAVKKMTPDNLNVQIDVSDVMKSAGQEDIVRVLFAEVPGVVVQIGDIDFDYMDAELLLQDVAFFPLGHPCSGRGDVRVRVSQKTGIQKILESLVQNQCGEGED